MAFLSIPKVAIRGISACVPANIEENKDLQLFKEGEAARVINQTGIRQKHTVKKGTVASDLCAAAFEKLLDELKWERNSIDILVLVTTSHDYLMPPTVCILQDKLGLPETTMTLEINQGCPGWIQGLCTLSSLLSQGSMKRGVLLCGDSPSLQISSFDKETRPLFGDAGTATALEYNCDAPVMEFEQGTRGSEFKAIWVQHGGLKNPFQKESLQYIEYEENKKRRPMDMSMDGMSVFGFGLSVAPKSILSLSHNFNIDLNNIDHFIFHQANQYMNEKIRKKLKIEPEKVPYSLHEYGNTSVASIPLTIVTQCAEEFRSGRLNNIACAFGLGLAWGSVHFITDKIVCPKVVLY